MTRRWWRWARALTAAAAVAGCGGDDGPIECTENADCPAGTVCAETGLCNATGLSDRALVARYFVDEAAVGIAPPALEDDADDPLALPVVYGTDAEYTDRLGNRGLSLRGLTENAVASAPLAGTKLETALAGASQLTIELVVEIDRLIDDSAVLFEIGNDDDTDIAVRANRGDTLIRLDSSDLVWPVQLVGRRLVLHLVVDASIGASLERSRLYIGGNRQNGVFGDLLTGGFDVDLGEGATLTLANQAAGGDSYAGVAFYAAIYGAALTESEVAAHARRLATSDDSE